MTVLSHVFRFVGARCGSRDRRLGDGAGNWHLATAALPCSVTEEVQPFLLRLTPPLATVPEVAEVVVTGPATRAGVTVPVQAARAAGEDRPKRAKIET